MMRCVKNEVKGGGGTVCRHALCCMMKPYGDTNLLPLKCLLQALRFISYICKVPGNILVTLTLPHNIILWVGLLAKLNFQLV